MRQILPFLFLLPAFSALGQVPEKLLPQVVEADMDHLVDLYRILHANPELSFQEKVTASRLAWELRQVGFEVTEGVGGTGIVGILRNGQGPTLLIRTDMDALPVTEETGLEYASQVIVETEEGNRTGVMHACGHDIHMSVWTGTARSLAGLTDHWKGTLVMVGQPAEERGAGARQMLADGLYERFPRPDATLALHCDAGLAAGKIGLVSGYMMANADMVDITIYGRGGHGAYPHETIDPVVMSAQLILDLQTIVSREISAIEPAVITVGAINGGTKHNIIPNEVRLQLTLRSYTDEVRDMLIDRIRQRCKGLALAHGLPDTLYPRVEVRNEYTPAVFNDPELVKTLEAEFHNTLGENSVADAGPVMVSEDFSRYGRQDPAIPSCLFWLGTISEADALAAASGKIQLPSLHSSKYGPLPEPSIRTGVLAMTAAAIKLMAVGD